MEMSCNGVVTAEVVSSDSYTIINKKELSILVCYRELNVEMIETSDGHTMLIFQNLEDMLLFERHFHCCLEERLWNIKRQHMTEEVAYAFKFTSDNFQKHVQGMI